MKKAKNRLMVLALTGLMAILVACGEKGSELVGTWVQDDYPREMTFYEDGTYTASGQYGTGHWSVLDNGDLKCTDFYGSTGTVSYQIKGNKLIIEKNDGDVYYVTYTKK